MIKNWYPPSVLPEQPEGKTRSEWLRLFLTDKAVRGYYDFKEKSWYVQGSPSFRPTPKSNTEVTWWSVDGDLDFILTVVNVGGPRVCPEVKVYQFPDVESRINWRKQFSTTLTSFDQTEGTPYGIWEYVSGTTSITVQEHLDVKHT